MIINGKEVIEINDKSTEYSRNDIKHIFLIGSKGIPASYGGFETFVEKLTLYRKSECIKYHVSRISNMNKIYEYNKAEVFNLNIRNIGTSKAVLYDVLSLKKCISICEQRHIENPVIYIMACRIGPFIMHYKKKIEKFGGKLYLNPDGHEWKRAKWNTLIKQYWKFSEKLMVKNADLVVCDSINIENYIQKRYAQYNPKTTYIAYGCDIKNSPFNKNSKQFAEWLIKYNIKEKSYYLIVCRFVPENNFEIIIKEFMKSDTYRDLVIITNVESKFLKRLKRKLNFTTDKRIKFVGTVYNEELLRKIRENAFAYIHGHEVGGTNPSLLEALGTTKINLLLNVGFNREVGKEAGIYWEKTEGNLCNVINHVDRLDSVEIDKLGNRSKDRIKEAYSWDKIVDEYENLFLNS